MIKELKNELKGDIDYLQVFTLSIVKGDQNNILQIQHSQEVTEYSNTVLIIENPIEAKIFILSSCNESGEMYYTMMLGEE